MKEVGASWIWRRPAVMIGLIALGLAVGCDTESVTPAPPMQTTTTAPASPMQPVSQSTSAPLWPTTLPQATAAPAATPARTGIVIIGTLPAPPRPTTPPTPTAVHTPTASELDLLWRQAAAQAPFAVFCPRYLLPGMVAKAGPQGDFATGGGLTQEYYPPAYFTNTSYSRIALIITELPVPVGAPEIGGQRIQVGVLAGKYQEYGPNRWIVLDREGTEIWLEADGFGTQDDLLRIAASLERVLPAAAQPPSTAAPVAAGPQPPNFAGDFSFSDPLHGWFLTGCWGGPCIRPLGATTDGGATWQSLPPPPFGVQTLAFATATDGWVLGTGLLTTRDGGRTWHTEAPPGRVLSISPIGSDVWMLVENCRFDPAAGSLCAFTIRQSTDTGRTWRIDQGLPVSRGVGAELLRLGPKDAWLFVSQPDVALLPPTPRLLATHDGGRTWHILPDPPCGTPSLSAILSPVAGYAGGQLWQLCGTVPGAGIQLKLLYRSNDAGQHWTLVATSGPHPGGLPAAGYVHHLAVSGPDRAWTTLDRNAFYGTTDGGHTWAVAIPLPNVKGDDVPMDYGQLLFINSAHGWLDGGSVLYRTTDGGAHWEALPHP